MPSAPRSRLAVVDVLLAHASIASALDRDDVVRNIRCKCNRNLPGNLAYADHIADELEAAASEPARAVKASHLRVLLLIAEARAVGLTDTQLGRRWAVKVARPSASWPLISDAGIRSRRAELVGWGLVEEVPEVRGRTRTNRPTRLWRLTDGNALVSAAWDEETLEVYQELLDEAGNDVVTRSALVLARSAASA